MRLLAILSVLSLCASAIHAQTLTTFSPPSKDTNAAKAAVQLRHVQVYLDGAIKGASDTKDKTSSAAGALGVAFQSATHSFFAQLTVAAKNDTVAGRFGAALLAPGSGSPLSSGLIEWRRSARAIFGNTKGLKKLFHTDNMWLRAYGTVSDARWTLPKVDSSAAGPAIVSATVGMVPTGYGLGLTYKVGEVDLDGKTTSASIDFGFMGRLLNGDGSNKEYDRQRQVALGTATRRFSGYEIGMNLQYGQITGGLTFYSFPNAQSVAGLARGQVIAGFALKADLISKWTQ